MTETYLIWKAESVALSRVHKNFCTISGSQDLRKTILDIIIRNFRFWSIFCLKVWCPILFCLFFDSLMLYINWFEPETYQRKDVSTPSQMCIARKIMNKYRQCPISSYKIVHHFKFLKSRLPDIKQKRFCTPHGATDPNFQIITNFVCSQRYYSILEAFFSGHPVTICLPHPHTPPPKQTHTRTNTHKHTHTDKHTWTNTHTHTRTNTHVTHTDIHTQTHTDKHTWTNTHGQTHTHTHWQTHTHGQTHMSHTRTNTHEIMEK